MQYSKQKCSTLLSIKDELDPCSQKIFTFLFSSNFEAGCFKKEFIASQLGYSVRSVERCLSKLKKLGYVLYRTSLKGWCFNHDLLDDLHEYEPKKNCIDYDHRIKYKQEQYEEFITSTHSSNHPHIECDILI